MYRHKLELQNEQEDNLEKFQEQMKKEEENERKKMQAKHELSIKSKATSFVKLFIKIYQLIVYFLFC